MHHFKSNIFNILSMVSCFAAVEAHAAAPLPSTDSLAPKIFHISRQAVGGDIIPIQGAYLSSSKAYYVSGNGAPVSLPIVNSVGDTWLAVQLPAQIPSSLAIYLQNSHGTSIVTALNAALPKHLDATRLVPGGAFRVFGSKLLVAGSTPSVTVGGLAATVNVGASNTNMLTVAAPTGLAPAAAVPVLVDNGAGGGPVPLSQPAQVDAGSGDPLGLGVGWGAGFSFGQTVVQARAACNGTTDDASAIESGIVAAAAKGGGIVQLPAGTCRITKTINLASRVVLKGAGQTATTLKYEGNYPIYASGYDLVGLQDLQLTNSGPVQEGLIWVKNTRSFIKRVGFNMGVSRQWFLTSNRDFVFDSNSIVQTGSYSSQNPYLFNDSAGLVFSNNRSTNSAGSPTFQLVRDSAVLKNRFTRDASSQYESTIVAHHSFVADFSYRVSLIGNTFDVINGPVVNKDRNDGETFLVEGGGSSRTENYGTVAGASATTLNVGANTINVDPFSQGSIPENYAVAIVAGKGAGQRRRVVSYASSTLGVDRPWDVVPDTTSAYSTFVWGLRDALLVGNTLTDNPRGIWLYQCSVEGVQIVGNTISEGGGIFVRSYHNASLKISTIQDEVLIEANSISNKTKRWLSYIALADVSSDPQPLATGLANIEIKRNLVVANSPNLTSNTEDYTGREGVSVLMHIEPSGGKIDDNKPDILGTAVESNVCVNCKQAYVIGTGDYGTTLLGNTPGASTPGSITDLILLGSQYGGSKYTVRR